VQPAARAVRGLPGGRRFSRAEPALQVAAGSQPLLQAVSRLILLVPQLSVLLEDHADNPQGELDFLSISSRPGTLDPHLDLVRQAGRRLPDARRDGFGRRQRLGRFLGINGEKQAAPVLGAACFSA